MVTPDGLSVSMGGGENKELLSLSPVQEAADPTTTEQQERLKR